MKQHLAQHYDDQFYNAQVQGSLQSGRVILESLFRLYRPKSIVDIGCGRGAWLAAAHSLGVQHLKGMDGPWVQPAELLSSTIDFTPVNFEATVTFSERYDLCISVEVAEHLSENRAQAFVQLLCAASDVVLFSAAIPYQLGEHHINEQRHSYWIQHFATQGYDCYDVLRPHIWNDRRIEWWYRQNVLLFVKKDATLPNKDTLHAAQVPITDLVHPDNYEARMAYYTGITAEPTLRFCLATFKRFLRNLLRGKFKYA